jgi:thiol:disulfide interchange protein DsbC
MADALATIEKYMKKALLVIVSVTLLLGYTALAWGFGAGIEGCKGDCTACHSVTRDEAQAMVRSFDPALTVVEVAPAPVRGLYKATVRKGTEETALYIDFSKQFIIDGKIIAAGGNKKPAADGTGTRQRIDIGLISLENALLMGNPFGARKLYVFTDPECPYCAQLHDQLKLLIKEDPQLAVYLLLYPLDIHPTAAARSDNIICASKTDMAKALRMLEQSFAGKELIPGECGKRYSRQTIKQATELGIGVTPSLVLDDGRLILGMKKKDELAALLRERLSARQ